MAIRIPRIKIFDPANPDKWDGNLELVIKPKIEMNNAVKKQNAPKKLVGIDCVNSLTTLAIAVNMHMTVGWIDTFAACYMAGIIDKNKPATFYLVETKKPDGKDQQRIYDIIVKSQYIANMKTSIARADPDKMLKLAKAMNAKIKDEKKRKARKQACLDYGLIGLSCAFDNV